ncbi:hypothetical protein B1748_01400 [Paenibacillus sp. MY03]|uniref:AraC family transcriptional regulator n=1 Tax=Paenibacillus sp. MY03 TaxID=302980 RepID=UPI000B3CF450|nr:AraC family transcriptional regulator [Paenibacillus sp. MY03]OUS78759.1 hypothetical protein B1748_01400 [Paenibacillus sp. MY03]
MKQLESKNFMNAEFPFWIHRYIHEEGVTFTHIHDFIELVYVTSGRGHHKFEGTAYEVETGDVFIINPGESHGYIVEEGGKLEVINCLFWSSLIHDTLLQEMGITQTMDYFFVHPFLDHEERFHHRLNLKGRNADVVLTLLEAMLQENHYRDPGFEVILRIKMIELLILLSRIYHAQLNGRQMMETNKHSLLVKRISGYLERNYEQRIGAEQLAKLFKISVRQLHRIFKLETNHSIIETLHRIRIDKAKSLLIETDEKIITIAGLLGYDDQAFFSRLFVRYVGCSPGKYRHRGLKNENQEV